jgi:antirestriction protein ArdC
MPVGTPPVWEGVTERARFGSERYSKEELVAELGAAFLSNEGGILDSVRFENSAAYLASWTQKLENDPRMIVSAASQAHFRAQDDVAQPPRSRISGRDFQPESVGAPAA